MIARCWTFKPEVREFFCLSLFRQHEIPDDRSEMIAPGMNMETGQIQLMELSPPPGGKHRKGHLFSPERVTSEHGAIVFGGA